MTWFGGAEIIVGVSALTLAVFLIGFFRFVPVAGDIHAPPGQLRLTIIPLSILLIVVFGFAMIFRGFGLV